jgi:NAD(P)-dependent dehydrogenase (short-subunit alcohol dehydrogenase family)|tara:strand:+ start:4193 stop:5179 length:987 start_codon:yes stop_codon:yes gene_type:complete
MVMGDWGRETTTDEVLAGADLSGRRMLVTGASGGLGEETARSLAAAGASVVMAARNPAKTEAAAARIRDRHSDADLELGALDLASLASVRAFADGFLSDHDDLHVLVNNAGIMCTPYGTTADGFEQQFGVNHLGHFLLTGLLMPALLAAAPARVVCLSSGAHGICGVDLDDLMFERRDYEGWAAYGQSKSANALFARELDRRLGGAGVRALAVHPGVIMTGLSRHLDEADYERLKERRRAQISAAVDTSGMSPRPVGAGAATSVWAATAPELDAHGGAYLGDCQLGVPEGQPGSGPGGRGISPWILDDSMAAALWAASEDLVGLSWGA